MDTVIKQAVNIAFKNILELLSSIGANKPFRKNFKKLFYEAASVWKEA